MTFAEEPEWMKRARFVPVQSTYDSRQPPQPRGQNGLPKPPMD